jgi:3-oxoacyl-[acyl-carrier-protein] synthase II
MESQSFYVNGIGLISPQQTFDEHDFLEDVVDYQHTVLSCITPDFKQFINPIQLRRLSRIQRIGLTAAAIAVKGTQPDLMLGVVTATGEGSSAGKGAFISEVLLQEEKQITPTGFVQSSYNNLAGLVAMTYRMMGYNNNFVSGGVAFETALQDAMLQLIGCSSQEILVGSYDESHLPHLELDNRTGHYKREDGSSLLLFSRLTSGTLWGESACFFRLSMQATETTWCSLGEPLVVYRPEALDIVDELNSFLVDNETDISSIDVLVSGASGDANADKQILQIEHALASVTLCRFKHLCGEYFTSTSFAVWLAASLLKRNKVPASTCFNSVRPAHPIKKVLVANHYRGRSVTFILLKI